MAGQVGSWGAAGGILLIEGLDPNVKALIFALFMLASMGLQYFGNKQNPSE
jgi:hypothetical protein